MPMRKTLAAIHKAVAVAAMALAEDLAFVELNPVVAHRRGVTVLDAVIRLGQAGLARDAESARAERTPGTSST